MREEETRRGTCGGIDSHIDEYEYLHDITQNRNANEPKRFSSYNSSTVRTYLRLRSPASRASCPQSAHVAGNTTTANTEETLDVHSANAPKVRKNGASHWKSKNDAAAAVVVAPANTDAPVARVAQNARRRLFFFTEGGACA